MLQERFKSSEDYKISGVDSFLDKIENEIKQEESVYYNTLLVKNLLREFNHKGDVLENFTEKDLFGNDMFNSVESSVSFTKNFFSKQQNQHMIELLSSFNITDLK